MQSSLTRYRAMQSTLPTTQSKSSSCPTNDQAGFPQWGRLRRIAAFLDDPLAHAAHRFNRVPRVAHAGDTGIAERSEPLRAIEGQPVAQGFLQTFGIDAYGLRIGIDDGEHVFNAIDGHEVG